MVQEGKGGRPLSTFLIAGCSHGGKELPRRFFFVWAIDAQKCRYFLLLAFSDVTCALFLWVFFSSPPFLIQDLGPLEWHLNSPLGTAFHV